MGCGLRRRRPQLALLAAAILFCAGAFLQWRRHEGGGRAGGGDDENYGIIFDNDDGEEEEEALLDLAWIRDGLLGRLGLEKANAAARPLYEDTNGAAEPPSAAEVTELLLRPRVGDGRSDALTPRLLNAALHLMDERFRIFKVMLPKQMRMLTQQCGINFGHIRGYGVEKYFVQHLHTSARWRTSDVAGAWLYYVPVVPCAARWEHKTPALSKEENYERAKKFVKQYVKRAVEAVRMAVPDGFFERNAWRDFFWVSSQDRGAEFAELAEVAFKENAAVLVNTASEHMHFRPCQDVSTVCSVNFDLPPIADRLLERADPWLVSRRTRVRGGADWNKGGADKEEPWHVDKPDSEGFVRSGSYRFEPADPPLRPRHRLAFFAGNLDSNPLRKRMYTQFDRGPPAERRVLLVSGRMEDKQYRQAMAHSTFCLHIAGHQVWSPRLMEYLWFGCVPVIIADGYHLPLAHLLDWSAFSIKICERDASNVEAILEALPAPRVDELRKAVLRVRHHFMYFANPKFGDAFHMTLLQLFIYALHLRHGDPNDVAPCDVTADQCKSLD